MRTKYFVVLAETWREAGADATAGACEFLVPSSFKNFDEEIANLRLKLRRQGGKVKRILGYFLSHKLINARDCRCLARPNDDGEERGRGSPRIRKRRPRPRVPVHAVGQFPRR